MHPQWHFKGLLVDGENLFGAGDARCRLQGLGFVSSKLSAVQDVAKLCPTAIGLSNKAVSRRSGARKRCPRQKHPSPTYLAYSSTGPPESVPSKASEGAPGFVTAKVGI